MKKTIFTFVLLALVILLTACASAVELLPIGAEILPSSTESAPTAPINTAALLPDLSIAQVVLGMEGARIEPGGCVTPGYGPYEVQVVVQNRGLAPAVNILVSESTTGTALMINRIDPGGTFTLILPPQSPAGFFDLMVDPKNEIEESNEQDNAYHYLMITPTPPLLCTDVPNPDQTPAPDASSGQPDQPVPGDRAIITWQSADQPCKQASFSLDGMVSGFCDGDGTAAPVSLPDYTDRLSVWSKAYAPFTAVTRTGTVAFQGAGFVNATEAEQRMIAEWAARMFNDGPAGRTALADGLVILAHAQREAACFDLSVYRDGRYAVISCQPGFQYPAGEGYLDAEALRFLYRWLDGLQPYQQDLADGSLAFSGAGEAPAGILERISIERMVRNLEFQANAYVSGGGMPPGAFAAQKALSQQLGIPDAQVAIYRIDAVDYPDTCRDAPGVDEVCEAVITPGLIVQLTAQGSLYEFHTDYAGYDLRPFGGPQPPPPPPG